MTSRPQFRKKYKGKGPWTVVEGANIGFQEAARATTRKSNRPRVPAEANREGNQNDPAPNSLPSTSLSFCGLACRESSDAAVGRLLLLAPHGLASAAAGDRPSGQGPRLARGHVSQAGEERKGKGKGRIRAGRRGLLAVGGREAGQRCGVFVSQPFGRPSLFLCLILDSDPPFPVQCPWPMLDPRPCMAAARRQRASLVLPRTRDGMSWRKRDRCPPGPARPLRLSLSRARSDRQRGERLTSCRQKKKARDRPPATLVHTPTLLGRAQTWPLADFLSIGHH